ARKISDLPREGVWLPGTHIIADTEEKDPRLVKAGGFWKLTLYHADQGKRQTFSDAVPRYTSVVGGSSDGKWLYLVTGEKL
ncbi:hypothetical protein MXD81_24240, partial [Microbacteriaceae bacterium K1510]|nr:hypothetical protein [Microbacteriaceae bacterium K1510]